MLLEVKDLSKSFSTASRFLGRTQFAAVQDISFRLSKRKTLAIIGRNGAGKSTLAKMIAGITEPSSGEMLFKQQKLIFGDRAFRSKHIRMLYQEPNASFNLRLNVGQILDTPLRLLTELNEEERNQKIFITLKMVGLYPDHANVKISTMSISQKQRVALARAIILEPEIIIADDSLNVLDMSVRTQLTNLMLELQARLGIAYIYVGQHIGLIKHIADDVLVMEEGKMMEYGATKEIFLHPQTEVTKRLVEGYFGHKLDISSWDQEKSTG